MTYCYDADHSKSTTRPDTDTDLRATGQADSAAGAAQQGLPLEMPINIMDDGRLAIFTDLHSMGYVSSMVGVYNLGFRKFSTQSRDEY